MKFFTLPIITSFILWPIVGSAELYKWTDEGGNLHITDVPPPELQRKSGLAVKPRPRSIQPMKDTPNPSVPERSRAQVRPLPESSKIPSSSKDPAAQSSVEGLSPKLATATSAWQTFDDSPVVANAPVQRWKDGQGVEHFLDVLPTANGSAGLGATPTKSHLKTR